MKAIDIHQHFAKQGPWADWPNTPDGFHFGDPLLDQGCPYQIIH